MADVKAELAAINDQLGKAGAEIVTKIGELEEKVANGTVTVEDLAPLKAQAQALDDIVPDAPTETETPGDGEGTVTPPEDGTV